MEKITLVLSVDTVQAVISTLATKLSSLEHTNDYLRQEAANAKLAKQKEQILQPMGGPFDE